MYNKEWNPNVATSENAPIYIAKKMSPQVTHTKTFIFCIARNSYPPGEPPNLSIKKYAHLHARAFAAWVACAPAAPTEGSACTAEIYFHEFGTAVIFLFKLPCELRVRMYLGVLD